MLILLEKNTVTTYLETCLLNAYTLLSTYFLLLRVICTCAKSTVIYIGITDVIDVIFNLWMIWIMCVQRLSLWSNEAIMLL